MSLRHLIALSVLLPVFASAQRFGGTPPSVKWRQVNTDTARIIYPAGLDTQAIRIAELVHRQAAAKQVTLGNRTDKINIVLQNLTTVSNGYVGMGPYRSEFYLTPLLNNFSLGSIPWGDQLSVHEYRHVQQFNNFNNGLSRLMRTLFGQEGYALAVDASVPNWFFEGDAVYNETVLTGQGRGRLPLFMNAYPSLWKAKKDYSWMKLRNGSLKDYVPGHYNLGYMLVNYGYGKYGDGFWKNVTHDASAYKGLFYPFQKAIARHAGVSYKQFREDAFEYYRSRMGADSTVSAGGPAPVYPPDEKVLTSYLFPYTTASGSTIYLKVSNQRRAGFVLADSSGEHWIRNRDISGDNQFTYRNGKIVYAGYENDKRWGWRDYSVIKIVDVDTRHSKTITHRSRYFTPDISPGGNRIAVVELPKEGGSSIRILDLGGKVEKTISAADIAVFTDPKFISEDSLLTAVRLHDGRMALAIADLNTGSLLRITDPSFHVIGYPSVDNGVIYFTASYSGSDQVFAIRPGEKNLYQLTSWPLGNYFVNVKDGKMSWSAFTAEGYQLQQAGTETLSWTKVNPGEIKDAAEPFPINSRATATLLPGAAGSTRAFSTSKYPKATRLLNFHSWRPYYEDPEFSFSLYGENVLNTLQTQVYYLYNENDNTNAVGLSAVYGALLPHITAGSQFTFGRRALIGQPDNRLQLVWNQVDTRVGLNIPLSWAKGQSYRNFNIGTDYVYRNDYYRGVFKDSFATTGFSYLRHYLSFGQQVETAAKHIFPRLGYNLAANYQHVLGEIESWQFLSTATLYMPGFFPTHSIVFRGGFQETDTLNAVFGNGMAYSRGYNAAYFSRMFRLSANYHFPLLYPDWGFGNILYIQRVRSNAFYDLTRVYSRDKSATADQRSAGGEMFFDTKWWNQYELTFGFRVSHLLDRDFYTGRTGANVFEFIVPVSIIPR
ncbi:MAG: hypothetical protein EOO09_06585 [Chitinophagaceae bacterium]|nr:MAG: hypothetical protein EOO09_06585 [Chitinophagaceae bacterium]